MTTATWSPLADGGSNGRSAGRPVGLDLDDAPAAAVDCDGWERLGSSNLRAESLRGHQGQFGQSSVTYDALDPLLMF